MSINPDAGITKSLSLDPSKTSISSYGSSCFSSTFKITSTVDGAQKFFFVKTGSGKDSELMFAGEHESLNAIHAAVPSLCPRSHAHGPLSSGGFFLATDFLTLSSSHSHSHSSSKSKPSISTLSLAQKLINLHNTPAPIPPGHSTAMFGFPFPTCCGNTVQDNTFTPTWADFYANNRLRHILRLAEKRYGYGHDSHLSALVEKTASEIVPRLLRDGHLKTSNTGDNVVPVVVHGDLWSGNHGRGRIGDGEVEEVVFDPSASWSHSEFEFGIMRMFGGLGSVEREYFGSKEKDEPVSEFEDRVRLYELYHHLNHYSMFGGGYKGGAVRIMEDLIQKYG